MRVSDDIALDPLVEGDLYQTLFPIQRLFATEDDLPYDPLWQLSSLNAWIIPSTNAFVGVYLFLSSSNSGKGPFHDPTSIGQAPSWIIDVTFLEVDSVSPTLMAFSNSIRRMSLTVVSS
jgi:hypothetical protein